MSSISASKATSLMILYVIYQQASDLSVPVSSGSKTKEIHNETAKKWEKTQTLGSVLSNDVECGLARRVQHVGRLSNARSSPTTTKPSLFASRVQLVSSFEVSLAFQLTPVRPPPPSFFSQLTASLRIFSIQQPYLHSHLCSSEDHPISSKSSLNTYFLIS
jgi:hypothetical protein